MCDGIRNYLQTRPRSKPLLQGDPSSFPSVSSDISTKREVSADQSASSEKMALLHSSQPTHTSADSSVVLLLVPVREFPPHVCDEQDPRPLREEISPPPKFQRM